MVASAEAKLFLLYSLHFCTHQSAQKSLIKYVIIVVKYRLTNHNILCIINSQSKYYITDGLSEVTLRKCNIY